MTFADRGARRAGRRSANCNIHANFIPEFSIENAERVENCPWGMMGLYFEKWPFLLEVPWARPSAPLRWENIPPPAAWLDSRGGFSERLLVRSTAPAPPPAPAGRTKHTPTASRYLLKNDDSRLKTDVFLLNKWLMYKCIFRSPRTGSMSSSQVNSSYLMQNPSFLTQSPSSFKLKVCLRRRPRAQLGCHVRPDCQAFFLGTFY